VIGAGQFIGLGFAGQFRRRPEELRALQSALLLLETEITYTATPLPAALSGVAQRSLFPAREIFSFAAGRMQERKGVTASEAWNEAMVQIKERSALRETDWLILQQLGAALGASSAVEQEKHLRLAREQLRQEEELAEKERARCEPIYRYGGLLSGLLLAVLLL